MTSTLSPQFYLLALGSNRASRGGRSPQMMLTAAIDALQIAGVEVRAKSPIFTTLPIGPARRRFANCAVLVRTQLSPPQLLALAKSIERRLGRRRGERWGNRTIDIDIILWSGGHYRRRTLHIPHLHWQERAFVLTPLVTIAPLWRDPQNGLSVRQIAYRHIASRRQPKAP